MLKKNMKFNTCGDESGQDEIKKWFCDGCKKVHELSAHNWIIVTNKKNDKPRMYCKDYAVKHLGYKET